VLPTVPERYRKVVSGAVVEMSQAEKDAVDAPILAAQAKAQAFTNEINNNDACNADMDVLSTRIDNAYAAANTASEVKQLTATIMKKLVRCVRARATTGQ